MAGLLSIISMVTWCPLQSPLLWYVSTMSDPATNHISKLQVQGWLYGLLCSLRSRRPELNNTLMQ